MKKIKALVVGIFVSILFLPLISSAQEDWEKSTINYKGIKGDKYSISIPGANCEISAYKSGILEVYTEESDYPEKNSVYYEFNTINPPKWEKTKISWVVKNRKRSEGPKDNDAFDKKFKHLASKLPPEVRKMFRGHWDIR